MSIRAVILDYGEVISKPANAVVHREMLEIAAVPEALFDKHYWDLRLDFDAGLLDSRAYFQKIAQLEGKKFTSAQLEKLTECDARMWMDVNESMLAWTEDLKRAGLLTAVLSNIGDGVLDAMRRGFPWLAQFDARIWSCEIGIVKPNAAIYLHAVDELGVRPDEALFIDNLAPNVAGAEAAGLHGIVFEDVEQLSRELVRRGFALPLPCQGVPS